MTWLMVIALFAQALAPLSSAMAFDAQSGAALQVICTSSGVKMVNVASDSQPVDPMQAVSCPFCVMHTTANAVMLAPVVSLPAFVELAKPSFALPQADLHDGLKSAQPRPPRGPPLTV
jgi:hypothetical protein